jgi:predicted nucleic acid-binding protein
VEWVEDLKGKVVGIASPFIYYIERNPFYIDDLRNFFQSVDRGEISIVTSTVTLLEVLVHPLRNGDVKLAQRYRDMLFHTKGLTTFPLSQDIAEEAAKLRAMHNIRTPDSIQMATAVNATASVFLTNDIALPSTSQLLVLVLDHLKAKPQN